MSCLSLTLPNSNRLIFINNIPVIFSNKAGVGHVVSVQDPLSPAVVFSHYKYSLESPFTLPEFPDLVIHPLYLNPPMLTYRFYADRNAYNIIRLPLLDGYTEAQKLPVVAIPPKPEIKVSTQLELPL